MTDDRELALKALRAKRDAYLQLFGPIDHPTPLGEIVLKDLKGFTKHGSEPHHFDTTQRLDPATTMYRLGKQMVYQRIIETIQWSEHDAISSRNPITSGHGVSSTPTDGGIGADDTDTSSE